MKTQPLVMHTIQYPISAIGCHIPIMGDPLFIAQCNWTRHFQQVTPEKFYGLLSGSVDETDKLSYTDNMGIIDTITQTVLLRYDMASTTPAEQNHFETLVASLITQRLIDMKVLRLPPKRQQEDQDGEDHAF